MGRVFWITIPYMGYIKWVDGNVPLLIIICFSLQLPESKILNCYFIVLDFLMGSIEQLSHFDSSFSQVTCDLKQSGCVLLWEIKTLFSRDTCWCFPALFLAKFTHHKMKAWSECLVISSPFFLNLYIIFCYMFTLKNDLVILLYHFVQGNALTSLTQLVPLSSALVWEWFTGLCNTWLKILTCYSKMAFILHQKI